MANSLGGTSGLSPTPTVAPADAHAGKDGVVVVVLPGRPILGAGGVGGSDRSSWEAGAVSNCDDTTISYVTCNTQDTKLGYAEYILIIMQ